ncbi:MAG: S-methyl-5-thioribose-1-phosphate isomerase [Candidatus ainarchaeum sp.]|nr:S-methyl-5-thioribose-1-phosphate isomerase [Candidatus ainarchaeum sp.]
MQKEIIATAKKIRSLKIQGKSAVRKAVAEALKKSAEKSRAHSILEFRGEIEKAAQELISARPTEPEARTAVRIILKAFSMHSQSLDEVRHETIKAASDYEKNRSEAMKTIAEYGANLIPAHSVVFTHCHSHTVEEILKKAGHKIEYVIATETRPLFQGRITATGLSKAGIKVKMIVDSAASRFMNEADFFMTGADAILSTGAVINKIGTSQISLVAGKEDVPHYVATSSHCFEPMSYYGIPEEIEERPPNEVWNKKLKKLEIKNPAFDITNAHMIKGIITEKGVFSPEAFAMQMYNELGIAGRREEFSSLYKLWHKKEH